MQRGDRAEGVRKVYNPPKEIRDVGLRGLKMRLGLASALQDCLVIGSDEHWVTFCRFYFGVLLARNVVIKHFYTY